MKTLLLVLLLPVLALGQSYVVPNFGGPVVPGIHAGLQEPGMFTYSENFIVSNGTRVTRYGTTKALNTPLANPMICLYEMRGKTDSLSIVGFSNGKWYYSNYGAYAYTGSSWRDRQIYYAPSYVTTDTLHTFQEVYPYTDGYLANASTANKFVSRYTPSDATKWMAFVEPGDSIFIDTSAAQSGKYRFAAICRYVEQDDRIITTAVAPFSYSGSMRVHRAFDTASIPDGANARRDLYVANGTDPIHRIFDSLGTVWMQEADLAYAGQITDCNAFFNDDSVSGYRSYEKYNDTIMRMRTRYVRIYDQNANWAFGEWSGQAASGATNQYFVRLGGSITTLNEACLQTQHEVGAIAPIVYNDDHSLIVLMPFSGDSTYEMSVSPYSLAYAHIDTTASGDQDTASAHTELRNTLNGDYYYIFSAAGKLETVLADSQTTQPAKTRMGGAMFWVLGQSADLLFDDSSYNDGTYFLHLIDKPQIRGQYRGWSGDTISYTYKEVERKDGFVPPSNWEWVRSYNRRVAHNSRGDQSTGYRGGIGNVTIVTIDVYKVTTYLQAPDLIDWPNLEYWPIRYVRRIGDTSFIITSLPVDTTTTTIVQSNNWEIVRMRVPRFSGLVRNADNTLTGWGDPISPELVSTSRNAPFRGGEPMNWNPASDFVVTPTADPIVSSVSYEDMHLLMTEHSIWGALTSADGFSIQEIAQNIGALAPRSAIVVNKDVFVFAADGYYQISRRSLFGYEVRKVSQQLDEVFNTSKRYGNSGHTGTHRKLNDRARGLIFATYNPTDERIWLFFPDDTASVPNMAATLDPATGIWDGFHNIGGIAALPVRIRDTVRTLLSSGYSGGMIWANYGQTDTGQKITSVVEGVVFNQFGDSLLVTPDDAWLTYSASGYNAGAVDSLSIMVEGVPTQVATTHGDTIISVRTPAWSPYTDTKAFYFHDAGSSRFWLWRLKYRSDSAVPRRWIQPVRLTINFSVNGIGK